MKPAPHPAKFSTPVLEVINRLHLLPPNVPTLDPMAGVGRIFEIAPWAVGLEIEPDWACADRRIAVGDCLAPPFRPGTFRRMVTSCSYGNRMSDHHNALERCRACKGSGGVWVEAGDDAALSWRSCPKCQGRGRRVYKRMTYKHQIGHELHPNNSGAMPWGPKYREFHEAAWTTLLPLLDDRGVFVLNVSNHLKTLVKGEPPVEQRVMQWHRQAVRSLGWFLCAQVPVETVRMGMGAHRDVRVDREWILVFNRG